VLPITEQKVSSSSKEIAKGSLWTLSGNIFYKLISFLYVVLIARLAPEEDVGLFYLSFGILQVIGIMAHLGIPTSLQRYVPFYEARKEMGKIRHLLVLSFAVVGISSIFFISLIWVVADFIAGLYNSPVLGDALRLFSFYVLLFGLSKIQVMYFQGRANMKAMQFVTNLHNILKLALTFIFFYLLGPTAMNLILGFLVALLIADLVSLVLLWNWTRDLPSNVTIPKQELLHDIIPLGLTLSAVSSIAILIGASDKILLGYLLPDSLDLVGIYGVATALATMLLVFPMSFGQIFMPVISRLVGTNDLAAIRSATAASIRWSMIVTLPVAVVLIAFSGGILSAVYGESYAIAGPAMAIFLLGTTVKAFFSMLSYVIAAMRKLMVELKTNAVMAMLNIVFTIILIPMFGMEGAAFGAFLSFLFSFFLLRHYAYKIFGFRIPGQAYRLLVAGGITLIPFLIISPHLSISALPQGVPGHILFLVLLGIMGAFSASIFLFLALVLKCFTKEDQALVAALLRRFSSPQPLIGLAEKLLNFGIPEK
jgi:stage V sporulation protein B